MAEKIKIVMIDDEMDLCMLVKANLESNGNYEVAVTSNPQDAENFVRAQKPDIILLDNVMPVRKGSEIAASLKKSPDTKNIPIVVVSGKGEMVYNKKKNQFQWLPSNPMAQSRGKIIDEKNPQKAAEAFGVEDYVSKPFTTELLMTVITDVLKNSKKNKGEEEGDSPGPGA